MGAAVKLVGGTSKLPNTRKPHKPRSPIDKAKAYEVIWQQVSPLFEAARICIEPCFVYFIGETDNGPLKIGLSKDPVARLRTMQTGNPRRLRIEYVLLGDMPLEKLLHEFWEQHAIHSARGSGKIDAAPGTEWFRPEVRSELLPIVVDAATRQQQYLDAAVDAYSYDDLDRIVRDAHADSGFIAQGRDQVRLMGNVGTVIASRRSRI